jgi:biopolymer transport protein ExbD
VKVGPRNGKYKIIAEINMIPFIDVALVLLIIFMVMTPFLVKSQLKVNLPKAESAEEASDERDTIDVQVDKDGAISVNGQAVAPDAVEAALRNVLLDVENQPVVIHADREVPFQAVVTVMDAAKKIGVAKLGVGVKQELPAPPDKKKRDAVYVRPR